MNQPELMNHDQISFIYLLLFFKINLLHFKNVNCRVFILRPCNRIIETDLAGSRGNSFTSSARKNVMTIGGADLEGDQDGSSSFADHSPSQSWQDYAFVPCIRRTKVAR